mgnify:CR=1 FL=1
MRRFRFAAALAVGALLLGGSVGPASAQEEDAQVRVVHNSPDAPAVDVAVAGGPVLFSNVAFPDATGFAEVDAGTYDLEAGTVYDVFAIGTLADGTLQALPLTASASGVGAALPAATDAQEAAGMDATGEAVHTMPHTGVGTDLAIMTGSWLAILSTLIAAVMGTLAVRFRFSNR